MKYVQWNLQKQKLCAWQNRIHSKRYFQCYSYGNTKCVHWSFKRNKPTTIEHIGNLLACKQFIHEKLQAFAKNKNAMACNLCNKRSVQSIIIKFIHGNNYWRTILDAIFRNKIQMIIIEIKMTFSASITHSNRTANSNGYKRALYPTKSTLINSITMNCTFDINSPVRPCDSYRRPKERKKRWWWTHTHTFIQKLLSHLFWMCIFVRMYFDAHIVCSLQ